MKSLQWLGFLLLCCASLQAFNDRRPDSEKIHTAPRVRWEEFPCPEEDDVTVVIDHGWDLDRTFFNTDGDIVIYLDIYRYLGTPEEISSQKVLDLLPTNVRLYLPAYDVDIHGSDGDDCAPEKDDVYFNGQKIGRLTGDNEIWHLHEFSIPFYSVNFPEAPGSFGRNEIRIKVDVGNSDSYWCTKIDWVALTFHAPRPVLMVHGLNSDGSTWNEMQKTLSQELGIPSEVLDVDGQGSISENAKIIRSFLNSSCHYGYAGLKKYYHVKEFNILAHSKGGLDSRYYVCSRGLGAKDIKNVMQIATPNAGCELAEKFYTLDLEEWKIREIYKNLEYLGIKACDATYDLRPRIMRLFNRSHPLAAAQAQISVLAGRICEDMGSPGRLDKFKMKIWNFLSNVSYGRMKDLTPLQRISQNGDGIVSVYSAHVLKNAMAKSPLTDFSANHIEIISTLAPNCIDSYSSKLSQIVYPKYQGRTSRRKMRSQPAAPPLVSPSPSSPDEEWNLAQDPAQGRDIMKVLYLEPEKKTEFAFTISQKQNLEIMLIQADKNLGVQLQLPSGEIIASDQNPKQFHYADELGKKGQIPDFLFFKFSGNFLYMELPEAEAGTYHLKLDGKKITQTSEYHFITRDCGPSWNLEARLRKADLSENEAFVIEARVLDKDGSVLKNSRSALSVKVREQRKFNEPGLTIPMYDDGRNHDQTAGDGIYTASVQMKQGALFDFFVKAEQNTRGTQDKRLLSLTGTRTEGTARILQEIREEYFDLNGNGLCDTLKLNGSIQVSAAGTYWVEADLQTPDGNLIQSGSVNIQCRTSGIYDFNLQFSGEKIFESKQDGPYILNHLVLARDEKGVLLDQDKPVWNYFTEDRKHLQFEHQPLFFLQTGSQRELDRNGDGLIDELEISVNLLVADGYQGHYIWSSNLLSEDGTVIASSHSSGRLEKTDNPRQPAVIKLLFPCERIAAGHYRGPFEIQMITLDNRSTGQVQALPCNYKTRAYSPFEFIKEANIINATEKVQMNFTPWTINRSTGAIASEITITNISSPADKPLDLVFRLAIPSDQNTRLCRIDGKTADGTEYMDITAEVEQQLLRTGNRDYKFDAGEQVKIQVSLFSRNRRIPDPQIYSFWADPPPDDQKKPVLPQQFFLDENQDGKIDDWEMLRGMNLWYNLRMNDAALLRLIKIWQTGSYVRNEAQCFFEARDGKP